MRAIEITFPVDVTLTPDHHRRINMILNELCEEYKLAHPDRVMWPAGFGSKPRWSRADLRFMGKPDDPSAPEAGEPSFDDATYSIEVSEREAHPDENKSPTKCAHYGIDDDSLRAFWRKNGGEFHGPIVEHGSIPEAKLLPLLRSLLRWRAHLDAVMSEIAERVDIGKRIGKWPAWREATDARMGDPR